MFAGLLIPIVVIGLAIAVLGIVVTVARNYRKVPPNSVLVVYGRKRKMQVADGQGGTKEVQVGYRLVIGGATFVMPMIESSAVLHLSTFQVNSKVENTPNIDGVPVDVEAIANMKISSDPTLLGAAVERLLSMNQQQLEQVASSTLEAQLRQIVGTLAVEAMIKDRESIQQTVLNVAQGELNKLGLALDNFGIVKVGDKNGYIDALGKGKTAVVKRDAAIAEAEATREQNIKTAEANRLGETAKAESLKAISDAERDRDMQIADNQAKVQARQKRITIEADTAGEEARAVLEQKRVAADVARVTADIQLQGEEKKRKEAELDATTVTQARKDAEALIIRAEAGQKAAALDGEALRIKAEKTGQGTQAQQTAEAEGRKATAAAEQAELVARAEGKKADLLATAAGREAEGKAEGEAKRAIALAEAAGLDAKNKALERLSDGARLIMVLEKLPVIIEEAGEAGEKIVGSAFEHVGQGLARIDEVRILDMGGGSRNGDGTPVANFAMNIPRIVAGTFAQFRAMGFDIENLLHKVGVDSKQVEGILGKAIATSATQDGSHHHADAGEAEAVAK